MAKLPKSFILQYISLFLVGYIILTSVTLHNSFSTTNSLDHTKQQSIWTHKLKLFCSKVQQRIANEKNGKESNFSLQVENIRLISPNFNNFTRQQSMEIPYYYSNWRSSPDLPRQLTPCDHQVFTELLSILDYFFRQHQISYMMADGTLLGSYAHHDILAWDDDADLLAPIRERSRINTLLAQELGYTISVSNITDGYGNYDRLYFSWTVKVGKQNWSYPFIDIGYLGENSTYLWRVNCNHFSINNSCMSKRDIFPLVYRPLGEIWLLAPREPLIIFENLRWISVEKLYYAKNYSHKYDRSVPYKSGRAYSYQLYPYYPWVKRYCLKTYCMEQLVTMYNSTNITIHTVQLEKYRAELIFDSKLKNKTSLSR